MKNTKKDRIYFVENCKIIVQSKKVTSFENQIITGTFTYHLPTKTNELKVIIRPESEQKETYSVFCRFLKPGNKIGNQYSGKYNFHHYGSGTVLNAVHNFELFLNEALNQ